MATKLKPKPKPKPKPFDLEHLSQAAVAWLVGKSPSWLREHSHEFKRHLDGTYDGREVFGSMARQLGEVIIPESEMWAMIDYCRDPKNCPECQAGKVCEFHDQVVVGSPTAMIDDNHPAGWTKKDPTQKEIAERCEWIQSHWTNDEREQRNQYPFEAVYLAFGITRQARRNAPSDE